MPAPKGLTRLAVAVAKGEVDPITLGEVLGDLLEARAETGDATAFRQHFDRTIDGLVKTLDRDDKPASEATPTP